MTRKVEVTQRQMLTDILAAQRVVPQSLAALIGQGRENVQALSNLSEALKTHVSMNRAPAGQCVRLEEENARLMAFVGQLTMRLAARIASENSLKRTIESK